MKPRWLFLTLFASYSVPGRFLSIFYQMHQIDESHIGILMSASPFVSLFTTPYFCNLADRTGSREHVAMKTYAAFIASFLLQIIAIPSLQIIHLKHRFPVLLFSRLMQSIFFSASYPLIIAITISRLKQQHGPKGHERFGHERLWGAVSWALCSFVLGFLLDALDAKICVIHIGCLLMGSLFLFTLYTFENATLVEQTSHAALSRNSEDVHVEHPRQAVERCHDDIPSRSNVEAISLIMCPGGAAAPMFFNLIFWLAAGMSLVENLLFLFFQNELGASNLLCGISVIVTVIAEIPIFAKAPLLLERIGAPLLAIVGCLSYSIRGIGYSLSSNGWVALLNEPFHGITYGAFHTATVAYIAERTPTELEATGQSILEVMQNLGRILGAGIGGYIMQHCGSKILYKGAALIVAAATFAFGIADRLSRQTSEPYTYTYGQDGKEIDQNEDDTEMLLCDTSERIP